MRGCRAFGSRPYATGYGLETTRMIRPNARPSMVSRALAITSAPNSSFPFRAPRGYIRVAHSACEILGHPMGPPRRPLRSLGAEDSKHLAGLLKNLGLFVKK
jgi:hypothetical protein